MSKIHNYEDKLSLLNYHVDFRDFYYKIERLLYEEDANLCIYDKLYFIGIYDVELEVIKYKKLSSEKIDAPRMIIGWIEKEFKLDKDTNRYFSDVLTKEKPLIFPTDDMYFAETRINNISKSCIKKVIIRFKWIYYSQFISRLMMRFNFYIKYDRDFYIRHKRNESEDNCSYQELIEIATNLDKKEEICLLSIDEFLDLVYQTTSIPQWSDSTLQG